MRTIYMETTKISATKTAGEITEVLVDAGAYEIRQEFARDGSGKLIGVCFVLDVSGQEVPFRLPARADAMFTTLNKRRAPRNRAKMAEVDLEQAVRVAWRQILRWVQAQLALIETGMASAGEVFLPYIRGNDGRTLYEAIAAGGMQKLLPMMDKKPKAK